MTRVRPCGNGGMEEVDGTSGMAERAECMSEQLSPEGVGLQWIGVESREKIRSGRRGEKEERNERKEIGKRNGKRWEAAHKAYLKATM